MFVALVNEPAKLLSNEKVGPKLYVMELESPQIATSVQPGQFVHMLLPNADSHVLRRPFSVYGTSEDKSNLSILYQVVGVGTDYLTSVQPGTTIEMIGPVGHGWQPPQEAQKVLLVGGGVGAAPLFMLCETLVNAGAKVDMILGAQTEQAMVTRNAYEALFGISEDLKSGSATREGLHSCTLSCATDDGSYGHSGFCTALVEQALQNAEHENNPYDYMAVCGPEILMRLVKEQAEAAHIPCEVSMERRMACGIGACLSCVVDTVEGKKRACVDGPVFASHEVVW